MFEGFSKDDFDAYLQEKWSSNMFTLQRRKVKDKLDEVGSHLEGVFGQAGLQLVRHLSDDHPSLWNKKKVSRQWLFFSRDVSAKKELQDIIDTEKTLAETLEDPTPLYKHIFIGASVDRDHLEVGIRLHHDAWVDRKNLMALLEDEEAGARFIDVCAALPDGFELGVVEKELADPAKLDRESLRALAAEFGQGGAWLFLGRRMTREEVMGMGMNALESIKSSVSDLIPIYRFMAWSPENDAVSIDSIVQGKLQQRKATHEELESERKRREEEHRQLVEKRQRERELKKEEMLDEQAWRERERAKRRAAASAKREAAEAAFANMTTAREPKEGLGDGRAPQESGGFDGSDSAKATSKSSNVDMENSAEASEKRAKAVDVNGNGATPRRSKPNAGQSSDRKPRRDHRDDRGPRRDHREGRSGDRRPRGYSKPYTSAPSKRKPANVSEERKANIQVGDLVKVVSGFLKDREGVVESIDERGDLKVSFGALSSRVGKKDVSGQGPAV